MKSKTLITLFLCNFIIFVFSGGLVPLLPVYATRLGATSAAAGLYVAFGFLMLITGAVLMGWLRRRLALRSLFIAATVVMIVSMGLLSRASTLLESFAATGLWWFSAGIALILINIFVGQSACEGRRGQIFALVNLATPLGSGLGGLVIGSLVDQIGFSQTFLVVGAGYVFLPLLGIFGLSGEDSIEDATVGSQTHPGDQSSLLFSLYGTLMAVSAAIFLGGLGVSLVMERLAFSAGAISSTATAGGIGALVLLPLMGTLSDHLGRRAFLIGTYFLAMIGLMILTQATLLWHFWLVQGLLSVANVASVSLIAAWLTDLLPADKLPGGLTRLSGVVWVGGILGYTGAGLWLTRLAAAHLFMLGAGMALAAALVLMLWPVLNRVQLARETVG